MTRQERIRRAIAVTIAAFALAFFWCDAARVSFRIADAGASVRPETEGYRIIGITAGGASARAGLRVGDIALAGDTGVDDADVLFSGRAYPPERFRPLAITVQRGPRRLHSIVHALSRPRPRFVSILTLARLLSYTLFVVIGTWVVIKRATPMTLLLLGFCLGSVAPSGDIQGVAASYWGDNGLLTIAVSIIALAFGRLNALFPLFTLRFPNDELNGWRKTAFRYSAPLLAVYAIVTWLGIPFYFVQMNAVVGYVDIALDVAAISILVVMQFSTDGSQRQRFKWALAATLLGVACDMGNEAARVLSHRSEAGIAIGACFTVLAALMPVMLVYAILKHHVFDIVFVINKALVYGATSIFVIVVLSTTEFLVEHLAGVYGHAENVAAQLVIALGVVFLIRPIHTRVDDFIDHLFFHDRRQQEETLRAFAEAAADYENADALMRQTARVLEQSAAVRGVALYRLSKDAFELEFSTFASSAPTISNSDPAARTLLTTRRSLDLHHVATAFPGTRLFPTRLAGHVTGIVALGERQSGDELPPDLAAAVTLVAEAWALAMAGIAAAKQLYPNPGL